MTQDIVPGETGFVTTFGVVRNQNTTGAPFSETWTAGDILYANPNIAGGFTNVRPTTPDIVEPMGFVLNVDETAGTIFIRPVINSQEFAGEFSATANVAVAAANTAYTIAFNNTISQDGVSLAQGNPSRIVASRAGYYNLNFNGQINFNSGGAGEATMYVWIRKNGVDVPGSMRRQSVAGNTPFRNLSFHQNLSMAANDYIEIAYAGSSNLLLWEAAPATAFGPSTSAAYVSFYQAQQ